MTVTAMPHRQEYKDIELDILIDEIGPGEGLLDSGGIEISLKPAGKGGVAQIPAGEGETENMCVCTKERKGDDDDDVYYYNC